MKLHTVAPGTEGERKWGWKQAGRRWSHDVEMMGHGVSWSSFYDVGCFGDGWWRKGQKSRLLLRVSSSDWPYGEEWMEEGWNRERTMRLLFFVMVW